MVDRISSFSSFENPRQVKDVFRFQLNRLCLALEKGAPLSEINHQLKDLKGQAISLQNKNLSGQLEKLEKFVKSHWPLNEQISLEQLQDLKKIFEALDQETIF